MKQDQKLSLLKNVRVGLRVPDDWFGSIADALLPGTPRVRNTVIKITYRGVEMGFKAVVPAPGQEMFWERIALHE